MKKVLVAFFIVCILCNCKGNDEYYEDQKAYKKCIETEPSIDECIFDYVKYLPENMRKEL